MKSVRHAVIKEIIESQDIETQEELAAALRARNIDVTQATVSRDIKELRLLKVLSEKGSYKYATADKAEHGLADRFIRIFNESVISIVPASNLIVIKTISGSAHAAGEAIDPLAGNRRHHFGRQYPAHHRAERRGRRSSDAED